MSWKRNGRSWQHEETRLNKPFWEGKTLAEMSDAEWESLCDGCGRCCLYKFQDEDSDEMFFTNVACTLFDADTCQCGNYEKRFDSVPECADIRKFTKREYQWLPERCAYRLLFEGKKLKPWHPLISGDPESVHQAGVSMRARAISEDDADLEKLEDYIVEELI
ncbi:YcgN family cysteine cluster protein [Pseudomonadota bacterium]